MKNGSAEAFANHESLKRLKKQLEHATDEVQRKTILSVLAEEEAKAARLPDDANDSAAFQPVTRQRRPQALDKDGKS